MVQKLSLRKTTVGTMVKTTKKVVEETLELLFKQNSKDKEAAIVEVVKQIASTSEILRHGWMLVRARAPRRGTKRCQREPREMI